MPSLKELQKKKAKALENVEEIQNQIDEKLRKKVVRCRSNNYGRGCNKGTQIGRLTYIRTHWYERPSGCSDGDRWHEAEGQFICPKCRHKNRLYDRPEFEKLQSYFKDIKKVYDKYS